MVAGLESFVRGGYTATSAANDSFNGQAQNEGRMNGIMPTSIPWRIAVLGSTRVMQVVLVELSQPACHEFLSPARLLAQHRHV